MNITSKPSLFVGAKKFNEFSNFIAGGKYSSITVLVDESSDKYCLPLVKDGLGYQHKIVVKGGEENKTIYTCIDVWNQLAALHIDRKGLIINLGGGTLCDMGGFIASTYKRGIHFFHIPTTLLSMSDSCIGGKLAVDLKGYKNIVGLFKNPKAVYINPDFLKTLPEKYVNSGFGEIIKHAIISDRRFFNELLNNDDVYKDLVKLISRSLKIKFRIVGLDTTEKGVRKSLNFGHSFGHALETLALKAKKEELYHGEAIAAGMIMESYISFLRQLISNAELELIIKLISSRFEKVDVSDKDFKKILKLLAQDKKNEHNRKLFTLIDGIGRARINVEVTDKEILEALKFYYNL